MTNKKKIPTWGDKAQYTVAVDFDGVIHSYTSPWEGADVIPDPPVKGSIEWLCEISNHFVVVIHTTRGETRKGREAVAQYLQDNGFMRPVKITNEKIPALVYVDDRGYRFDGVNFPSRNDVHRLIPWNKRPMGLR